MAVKFFGQFLIERGVLSAEQMLAALDDQRGRNRRFGSYALQLGYLRPADVQRIHAHQQMEDSRFGEAAVQLGLLSETQVQEILLRQRQDHIMLGELLVERGDVTPEVLASELTAFREDQSQWSSGDLPLPHDVADAAVVRAVLELSSRLLARTTGEPVKLDAPQWQDRAPASQFAVHVRFSGQRDLALAIACDLEAAERLTAALLGDEALSEGAEVIADAVREFANVVAGSVMARLAQLGVGVEISPPADGVPTPGQGRLLGVQVLSGVGDVRFFASGV